MDILKLKFNHSFPLLIKIIVLLFFIFNSFYSFSAVLTVGPSGQYLKIQWAINVANNNDEIIVAEGTYVENISFNGMNIILHSTNPEDTLVVSNTIIDGNDSGSVVKFNGTENETCVLSGFTIRNGYTNHYGGGINGNGTKATIKNNNICNNTTYDSSYTGYPSFVNTYGGGLYKCNGIIENNNIYNNTAHAYQLGGHHGASTYYRGEGGGLYDCNGIIRNNKIFNNSAGDYGGGVCGGVIINNLIYNNQADGYDNAYGAIVGTCGGLYASGSIFNNTIYSNNANYSPGGIFVSGTICNNIIWANTPSQTSFYTNSTITYNCIQNWSGGGTGNISYDPQLVDPDGPDNNLSTAEDNDFHLKNDSPCIDAGTLVEIISEDFEGDPRGVDDFSGPRGDGSEYDIGVDETIYNVVIIGFPEKPTNILPADGAIGVSSMPTLKSSAFSHPDPSKTHKASEWQIDDNPDFSSPEFTSGVDTTHLTTITIPQEYRLGILRIYYWRVRHRDNINLKSPWSDATVFTTPYRNPIIVPDDYLTINKAVNAAITNVKIIVQEGTYIENVNINGKNIILSSTNPNDPEVVAKTIIDGNQSGSVITFAGTETSACIIQGLTTRNGRGTQAGGINGKGTMATIQYNNIINNSVVNPVTTIHGGGIFDCDGLIQYNIISNNSVTAPTNDWYPGGGGLGYCDGTIQNNNISWNSVSSGGGGLQHCMGIIQDNMISYNSANGGGGLYECHNLIKGNTIYKNSATRAGGGISHCDATIEDNYIYGNYAAWFGGGIDFSYAITRNNIISGNSVNFYGGGICYGGGIIECNLISNNSAAYGGAFMYGNPTVQNNIISNNFATISGGAIDTCGSGSIFQNNTIWGNSTNGSGGGLNNYQGIIRNCIIWQNSAPSDPQIGNSVTPTYSCIQDCSAGGEGNINENPMLVDPENGNFHLNYYSPCIDAGMFIEGLTEDFEGDLRGFDGTSGTRGDGSDFDIGADEFIGFVTYVKEWSLWF